MPRMNISGPPPKKSEGIKYLARLMKLLLKFYPVHVSLVIFCILFSAACSSIPSIFIQKVIFH